VGTIDEDGSFDVVEPTRIDVRWWSLVAECLPGSWLVHPADFIRARASRQARGGILLSIRGSHTKSHHLARAVQRSEVTSSLLTWRFLTLKDMF
jgi:hypothetical protein